VGVGDGGGRAVIVIESLLYSKPTTLIQNQHMDDKQNAPTLLRLTTFSLKLEIFLTSLWLEVNNNANNLRFSFFLYFLRKKAIQILPAMDKKNIRVFFCYWKKFPCRPYTSGVCTVRRNICCYFSLTLWERMRRSCSSSTSSRCRCRCRPPRHLISDVMRDAVRVICASKGRRSQQHIDFFWREKLNV